MSENQTGIARILASIVEMLKGILTSQELVAEHVFQLSYEIRGLKSRESRETIQALTDELTKTRATLQSEIETKERLNNKRAHLAQSLSNAEQLLIKMERWRCVECTSIRQPHHAECAAVKHKESD